MHSLAVLPFPNTVNTILTPCIHTLAVGFFVAFFFILQVARAESFDKPLHTRVLDLGRSQYLMRNDARHVRVTCRYYKHFMIKEKDDPGVKGAELIALAPAHPGKLPRCSQTLRPNEKEFKEWHAKSEEFVSWNGYFSGVKNDLIFLRWPDGDDNSGIPFAAFKADAQTTVFKDSATVEVPAKRDLNFLHAHGDQITMHYLRVTNAGCSIPKSGESCWTKLQQQTGLAHTPMPQCSDYEGNEAGTAPSVIAYPVEVSLYPKPSTRPLGGPVRCYPTQ